jgi:PiT family inorganic phosphate transporter
MTTSALNTAAPQGDRRFDHKIHPAGIIAFCAVLFGAIIYAGTSISIDTSHVGEPLAIGAFAFLGLALLIALGFEFVNGFHDTANAVATVIYTNSLSPVFAVV